MPVERFRQFRAVTAALHADKVRQLRHSGLAKSEIAGRMDIGLAPVRRILAAPSTQRLNSRLYRATLPSAHCQGWEPGGVGVPGISCKCQRSGYRKHQRNVVYLRHAHDHERHCP